MKLRTLALLALAGCNQPITPHVGAPEVPAPTPAPIPAPHVTSPEACPAVPIATVCEPGGPCWKNPRPMATSALTAVWSHGCTAWAVGTEGQLLRRTSEGWKPQPRLSASYFHAITGTADDDVWVVGMNKSIFHFDGVSWAEEAIVYGAMPYQAAWTAERGVVYVAGYEGVHRFELKDGRTTFTTLLAPEDTQFSALIGKGNTLRALAREQGMFGYKNVLWSFDGTAWTKTVLRDEALVWSLIDVDGALYGAGQLREGQDWLGYLSQLAPNSAPSSSTERSIAFGGLAGRSNKEIIVVGPGRPDGVLRFDGLTFTPITGAPQDNFWGITQSGRDYFVIGNRLGRISGDTWISESEGPTDSLSSAVRLENGDVWLSNGWRSTVASGDQFSPTFTEPNRSLWSVSGVSNDDMWGSDWNGVLWHFDGTSWSRPANPPGGAFGRIKITGPGVGFAVGSGGLWRLTGSTWTSISLPNSYVSIHDLMVGTDGMLMVSATSQSDSTMHFVWRLEATSGAATAVPAPQPLRLLAGLGTNDVFGLSEDSLFHFDGATWSLVGPLPQDRGRIMSAALRNQHRNRELVMGTSTGRVIGWGGSRYFDRFVGASVALYGLNLDPRTDEIWATGAGGTVVVLQ